MMLDINLKQKYLDRIVNQLLLRKRWSYLRYIHLREGLKKALAERNSIKSFLSVGCGLGLAELALAIEYSQVHFYLTDFDATRYKMAQNMVKNWSLLNVEFGMYNALSPSDKTYDFVASIEVIEHIENDVLAFKNMCKTAEQYLFCLVPFATDEMNADRKLRNYVWRKHEHYRCGYNTNDLIKLAQNNSIRVLTIRGCYWQNAGFKLRKIQEELSDDCLLSSRSNLIELATTDIREDIPIDGNQLSGIWMLLQV
ncbi:class I SAM-dependent methyltransferase [Zarconia navalis]|nr:class I SAM-dependent methyltransferase [Zarconia navalis]